MDANRPHVIFHFSKSMTRQEIRALNAGITVFGFSDCEAIASEDGRSVTITCDSDDSERLVSVSEWFAERGWK